MTWVSAVIPTYNRPEFLRDAIESVLAQRHVDVECVVVDDGSDTDYTEEVVEEYPETVRCLVHRTNRGLSAARNTGIEAAGSKYVAFLDDDDRWARNKLSEQVQALERSSDAGLATCLLAAVSLDGDLLRCEGSKPEGDLGTVILRRNVIGSPSRVVATREALLNIGGFDESLPTKQDWDLYIRLSQEYDIVCVDDHLCYRTIHQSMSSNPEDERDNNMRVIEKHEELIRERGTYDRTMGAYHAAVGRTFLEAGDAATARMEFRRALSYAPSGRYVLMFLLTLVGLRTVRSIIKIKRLIERRRYC